MPILKDLKGSNRDNLIRINLDSITQHFTESNWLTLIQSDDTDFEEYKLQLNALEEPGELTNSLFLNPAFYDVQKMLI